MRGAAAGEERRSDGSLSDAGAGPPRGEAPPQAACELCGGPLLDRHCKLLCLNCGYQRDCSDP